MRTCSHCKLEILDITDHCPLCNAVLEQTDIDENETGTYPDIYHKIKKLNFVFRIILFLAIVVAGVSIVINVSQQNDFWWSIIVCAGLIYTLLMLYVFVNDGIGYLGRIFTGFIGGAILVILIDYIMGFHGWSVDYVLPATMILADVTLLLLMIINRRNWQSYMIVQIIMILMGIVPLVLIYFGIVKEPAVSEAAFGCSIILFLGSVILGGRTAVNELKRRFHI